jgi:hypothetical protein
MSGRAGRERALFHPFHRIGEEPRFGRLGLAMKVLVTGLSTPPPSELSGEVTISPETAKNQSFCLKMALHLLLTMANG